jgi:hypothetical protein
MINLVRSFIHLYCLLNNLLRIQIQAFSVSVKVINFFLWDSIADLRASLLSSTCSGESKASIMTTSTLSSPSFRVTPANPIKRQVMNWSNYPSFPFVIKITAL